MTNLQAYTIKETDWKTSIILSKNKHHLVLFFQHLSTLGRVDIEIREKEIEGYRKFIIRLLIPEPEIEKIVEYINFNAPI